MVLLGTGVVVRKNGRRGGILKKLLGVCFLPSKITLFLYVLYKCDIFIYLPSYLIVVGLERKLALVALEIIVVGFGVVDVVVVGRVLKREAFLLRYKILCILF